MVPTSGKGCEVESFITDDGLLPEAVNNGRILDVDICGLEGRGGGGFGTENLLVASILCFMRYLCKALAILICSCSSLFSCSEEEPASSCATDQEKEETYSARLQSLHKFKKSLHCFKDDQAAIAAFFSACFLFLAVSPRNVIPANCTVPVKTGRRPTPDL